MHIYVVLKQMGLDLIQQEVTNARAHWNLKLTLFANICSCKLIPKMCSLCEGQALAGEQDPIYGPCGELHLFCELFMQSTEGPAEKAEPKAPAVPCSQLCPSGGCLAD